MPLDTRAALTQLLGLPPEATDAEIIENSDRVTREGATRRKNETACQKLMVAHRELQTQHNALLNSVVEGDMKRFESVIGTEPGEIEQWKKDLMTNRAGTIIRLEGLEKRFGKEPKTHAPLYNKATAKTPAPTDGGSGTVQAGPEVWAKVRTRAQELLNNKVAKTFTIAFKTAQEELIK